MTRNQFILTCLAALPFVGKYFKRKSNHDEGGSLIPPEIVKNSFRNLERKMKSLDKAMKSASNATHTFTATIPPEWESMTHAEQLEDCANKRGVVL